MASFTHGLVSVIIPVYNRAKLLEESVASALAQTYRPIEIIIVDDGSTDHTPVIIDHLAEQHEEITAIHIENSGPGGAREAGRKIASGEFIQYLDSDDILMPNKFEVQVSALNANPDCDVAYGKTRYYHINENPRNVPLKRTGEKIEYMFPAFLQSRWWATASPLFRKSVTDAAGPWGSLRNEEDWEYECRIASMGAKLCFCDEFMCDQRDHEDARLSQGGSVIADKLRDRAHAHELIYGHARKFGISNEVPEMQHFSRELFLLARQCGRVGLVEESKKLFTLSRETALSIGPDYYFYSLFASCFGWENAGRVAYLTDKLRHKI